MSSYLFDNAAKHLTAQRFGSQETLYDPRTTRFLEATGVGLGWRCLQVGGGSGSIAAWLAERVGDRGHLLVTDIDPRFLAILAASGRPNVQVRWHDIGAAPCRRAYSTSSTRGSSSSTCRRHRRPSPGGGDAQSRRLAGDRGLRPGLYRPCLPGQSAGCRHRPGAVRGA